MERSFSPILRKIAGEVVSKPKRSFTSPTEVCLEDWWLSKPKNEEGIAISGRPIEIRKCDDAGTSFNLASPMRRYASREFHSTKVAKRHSATMLETCDGFLISLCGFINKSRTQENGFTSDVCRDFIYGFPFNWDDYTAQSADEEMKSNENFIENFTPDILDSFNEPELGLDKSPKSSHRSVYSLRSESSSRQCVLGLSTDDTDMKASKKQRLDTSMDVYSEQDPRRRSGGINADDEHAL